MKTRDTRSDFCALMRLRFGGRQARTFQPVCIRHITGVRKAIRRGGRIKKAEVRDDSTFSGRISRKEIALLCVQSVEAIKYAGSNRISESCSRSTLDESLSESTDGSLLRRYKTGDQAAATRLYLKYAHRLHGLAVAQTGQDLKTRIDPEDIVQSVFRTFFRRAKDGHYQVPDGQELWKLFLVIGLHKIRDAEGLKFAATAPDELAENTLQMVIDELLQNLNSSQKEIIMLRLDGMIVDDIAESTKRSRRTVERTLQKFRELLQHQLED